MSWPERKGRILYQSIIMRGDLRANPYVIYVFGDNLAGYGLGGQAKEIRGEKNAIGIPTKRSPSTHFYDSDFDEARAAIDQKIGKLRFVLTLADAVVVFPLDGIGTGLARLAQTSPRIWAYLQEQLNSIGAYVK